MFKFYDEYGMKYNAISFKDVYDRTTYFKDLSVGILNGKKVNLKTFAPKGAEVLGNLVYKNGIITMGAPENFRTQYSFNSNGLPLSPEPNSAGTAHTHQGNYFNFSYKVRASDKGWFGLNGEPNVMPSLADQSLVQGNQRNVVVSATKLFIYSNVNSPIVTINRPK